MRHAHAISPKPNTHRLTSDSLRVALLASLLMGLAALAAKAQSTSTQPAATPTSEPQWQSDAGSKMQFDVASVKPDKSSEGRYANFSLGPGDDYSENGGLFTARNLPVSAYVFFAYKVTINQLNLLLPQLPKWVTSDGFDIQARAPGNPTKDQMRLMMQSLLADRFKLAIHYETRQLPVFALVLVKPGKTGPLLKQHPDGSPCSLATSAPGTAPAPPTAAADDFPSTCGGVVGMPPSAPGLLHAGGRNVSMELIASTMSGAVTGIDRPVVDRTALKGTFDFALEFVPELNSVPPNGTPVQAAPSGPAFSEALKDQLGLKLESQKAPFQVIVVDHVEEPSEN